MPFYYDYEKNYHIDKTCFMIYGERLGFLTALFNSPVFRLCFRSCFPELGGYDGGNSLGKIYLESISLPNINEQDECSFLRLVKMTQKLSCPQKITKVAYSIEKKLHCIFQLTPEMITYLRNSI